MCFTAYSNHHIFVSSKLINASIEVKIKVWVIYYINLYQDFEKDDILQI